MLGMPNPHGLSNAFVLKRSLNARQLSQRREDSWVVDFGIGMLESDASLFEAPFAHVAEVVLPERTSRSDKSQAKRWWLHARPSPVYRAFLQSDAQRVLVSPAVSKHRTFSWIGKSELADHALVIVTRADDTTFGILHSRFHELWSLRMGTWLGKGNDPRYTPTTCFETFPFPAGLTPLDTAHQRTEAVAGGALIPAGLPGAAPEALDAPSAQKLESNRPPALMDVAQPAIETIVLRQHATAIAQAAQRLNTLREAWLNPPEWTTRVPEVVPLGMDASPYPDRIVAKVGFEKELAQRTLTKLYNQRPAWLASAHQQLDAAVAAAYGWHDYTGDMADDEILRRLLALNLARSAAAGA